MQVLFLAKFSEIEDYLLHFSGKVNARLPLAVDLLHVVHSYPQVPLQPNGTIIDHCVDFDLSSQLQQKANEENDAVQLKDKFSFIKTAFVEVGDLERIVKYQLTQKSYDLIIMGAHQTSLLEDLTHGSTIERILKIVDIPVLSLKCDQSHQAGIDVVGVFDDFKQSPPESLRQLSHLVKAFNSEVHLFKMVQKTEDAATVNTAKQQMDEFALNNRFDRFQTHVLSMDGSNAEQLIKEQLEKWGLQLIAISDLHRKSIGFHLGKSLKASIADHILAPLLIH